jgi:energy-coupling factor transport system permease protein
MVSGLSLALALAFYPAALRVLAKGRLWLLVAVLVVPASLLGGPPAWALGPLALSQPGLATGLQMGLRALAIVVGVAGFAASVSLSELAGLLERVGLKGLGFALGVAINVLPVIDERATTAFQALQLRGGFRRQRLQALRLLLVTVVANSLRYADDIVSAAEARAFSLERARPLPVTWRARDLALAGALAGATLALALVH